MQYKIPVKIDNEDPIVLGLSLRQLGIMLWGFGIWYAMFKWISTIDQTLAFIPLVIFWWLWVVVALFKNSEMTFIPFLLNFIRFNVNYPERKWSKWVDSFQPLDIWYITTADNKKDKAIDLSDKKEKLEKLSHEDIISKLNS